MKNAILIMMLAVMSTGAMAEWVEVSGNDTFTIYADPSTIRKNGNIAKMWHMYDYKKQQVESYGKIRSTKALFEYDCKGERQKPLSSSNYSGQLGEGKVVYTFGALDGDWHHVVPQTFNEVLSKIACGEIVRK